MGRKSTLKPLKAHPPVVFTTREMLRLRLLRWLIATGRVTD